MNRSRSNLDMTIGGALFAVGTFVQIAVLLERHRRPGIIGAITAVIGVVLFVRGLWRRRRAQWLHDTGVPLTARIVKADLTGTWINRLPEYRFTCEVAGPSGPYPASFTRVLPEHEVTALLGSEVRVRANPEKLEEIEEE
jgi:hypothetical protein